MKQKRPEWLGDSIHIEWLNNGVVDKELLDDIKTKLAKIGIHSFKPGPKELFRFFTINPDSIQWIVINSTPWVGYKDTPYEELSPTQKDIFDKLENAYGWEKAELYLHKDLSDWPNCMLLSTSLTNVRPDIWEPLMKRLFDWFNSNGNYYCFIFLDSKSFEWAKYVKKHEVFYGFHPEDVQEFLTKQWNYSFIWGLPF